MLLDDLIDNPLLTDIIQPFKSAHELFCSQLLTILTNFTVRQTDLYNNIKQVFQLYFLFAHHIHTSISIHCHPVWRHISGHIYIQFEPSHNFDASSDLNKIISSWTNQPANISFSSNNIDIQFDDPFLEDPLFNLETIHYHHLLFQLIRNGLYDASFLPNPNTRFIFPHN